jgi:SAM-dependent methyltransferase
VIRAVPTQDAIRRWFDRTYADRGLAYLRPQRYYTVFVERLGVRSGERLLDVGCGPGLLLAEARRAGAAAYGVDLSLTALASARRLAPGARLACANAEALPFRDGAFRHLTCIGTLEHFLATGGALSAMRRALADGGRACVMVPNARSPKWRLDAALRRHEEDSHERAAPFEEWRRVLAGSGLAVESVERDEWPRRPRRRRLLGGRYLVPMRWANQYVFLLRR